MAHPVNGTNGCLKIKLAGYYEHAAGNRRSLESAISAGGRDGGGLDCSKRASGHIGHGILEIRVIEHVVSAGADLQAHLFGEVEVFVEGNVRADKAGAMDQVAAEVA